MSNDDTKAIPEIDADAAELITTGEDIFEGLQDEVDAEAADNAEAETVDIDDLEPKFEEMFDGDFSFSDELAALVCDTVNTPAQMIGAKTIPEQSQKFLAHRYKKLGQKIAPLFGNKELGLMGEIGLTIAVTGGVVLPTIVSIKSKVKIMEEMQRKQAEFAKAQAAKDVTPKKEAKTDTPNPENTLD